MGMYQRIFRRGTRYWYRRTGAVDGGRRIDIRRSLGTSDIHEAKRRATMLDIVSVHDLQQNCRVFGRRSGGSAATHLPEPDKADLESAARVYREWVLRHYLGRHAGREDSWDFVRRQTKNIADFDMFDILIRTGATREGINHYRIDEEISLRPGDGTRKLNAMDRFQTLFGKSALGVSLGVGV